MIETCWNCQQTFENPGNEISKGLCFECYQEKYGDGEQIEE